MIYEYIITAFKVIVGVITHNRLALAALIALGVMVVWVFFSLLFSFQAKFCGRVKKINNYVSRNGLGNNAKPGLYELMKKMPYEFKRGFKKFESNPSSLPSDNINRFQSLDMELSGGVFNQNKSVIKTYINFVFVTLAIFSLAILSTEDALTGYMLAEALVIPLIFLITAKLVYYVYTAIRQYQYRCAVDEFNYMLDNLDKVAQNNYADPNARNMGFGNEVKENVKEEPQYQPVVDEVKVETINNHVEEDIEEPVQAQTVESPKVEKVSLAEIKKFQPEETNVVDMQPSVEEEIEEVVEEEFVSEITENEENSNNFESFFADLSDEEEQSEEIAEEKPEETVEEVSEEVVEEQPEDNVIMQEDNQEGEKEIVEEQKVYEDNFNPNFDMLLEDEEEVKPKRGRGRPKKEVSSTGELVINNDKEFEEALVRAEKLMRKNEEPLSASQTKRIEKQLKELVDAMSKYKEGK